MKVESDSLLPPPSNPDDAIISVIIPTSQRRPRVREVRSRFISPVVPSSSSSKSPLPDSRCRTQPLATSTQRRRQLDIDFPSENRPHVIRSLETPLLGAHRRREGNPLKDNGGGGDNGRLIRPDTMVVSSSVDRMVPSRYRQTPSQRSIGTGLTSATKVLHSNGVSFSGTPARINDTASREDPDEKSACGNEIDLGKSGELGKVKLITDVRCSIPEGDMLVSVSNSMLVERNGNYETLSKVQKSPPWRFPNSPFQQYGFLERPASGLAKQLVTTTTTGKVCLPPVPLGGKTLTDAKKGKKVFSHQENVHMLKLLHNHYLQWRFANDKAEASTRSLKEEAERMIFSVCTKVGDMHISVKRKLVELELLRRAGNVTSIVESQMPYLDEWSTIKGDYLMSISEAIQALSNVAMQLPMIGIARADVKEIRDAFFTAVRVMGHIASHVEKFTSKARALEVYLSELAKVTSGEKVITAECCGLLSETCVSQVRECSLRSQIMQSQRHQSLLIQ